MIIVKLYFCDIQFLLSSLHTRMLLLFRALSGLTWPNKNPRQLFSNTGKQPKIYILIGREFSHQPFSIGRTAMRFLLSEISFITLELS